MGNEESSRKREGIPEEKVQELLQQERRRYEQKLRETQVEVKAALAKAEAAARAKAAAQAKAKDEAAAQSKAKDEASTQAKVTAQKTKPDQARVATERNLDQMLGQQLQEFAQYIYGPSPSRTTGNAGATSQPSQHSSNLYPTLNNVNMQKPCYSATPPQQFHNANSSQQFHNANSPQQFHNANFTQQFQNTNAQQQFRNENFPQQFPNPNSPQQFQNVHSQNPFISPRQEPEGFVMVDNNRNTARFRPSAPLLPPPPASRNKRTPSNNRQHYQQRAAENHRQHSQTRGDEDQELNCPTCHNKYGLTIFQCRNGHSSCKECKDRCSACGICRDSITDMRNITLEAYISERKVPCRNKDDGCSLYLKLADMETHLKECPYKEFSCPRCSWKGKITQIVSHFDDAHPENRHGKVDTELNLLNICDEGTIMHMVDMGTFNFLVYINVSPIDRKLYMPVLLLGTGISASKWSYEFQIYNKSEPRRKLTFSDVCLSDTVDLQEVYKESKCVTISQAYAMTYFNQGSLCYKFYIKKDMETTGGNNRGKWAGRARNRGRGRGGVNA